MREPAALPLGQTARANKPSLCTDNLGSTSLVQGYVSEEYGPGLKMPISFVPDMTGTTACLKAEDTFPI